MEGTSIWERKIGKEERVSGDERGKEIKFGIKPRVLSALESLSPSFSSRNIHCGSLCARPCAGCGDAERNQTLLLEDSGSGARRTYSTSGQ